MSDVGQFQLGILKELALSGNVPLPAIRYVVAEFLAVLHGAEARAKAVRRTSGQLAGTVKEAAIPVGTAKRRIERRIITGELQRPQPVTVEVLSSSQPYGP